MTDDLVERLRKGVPYWTPPGAYMDRPNVSAGDTVMREAADAILKLQGEVAALRQIVSECATATGAGVGFAASLDFMKLLPREIQCTHDAATALSQDVFSLTTRLEAAEAEVARMREALAAAKVKPLDMWEAMDGARKPGEPTT